MAGSSFSKCSWQTGFTYLTIYTELSIKALEYKYTIFKALIVQYINNISYYFCSTERKKNLRHNTILQETILEMKRCFRNSKRNIRNK